MAAATKETTHPATNGSLAELVQKRSPVEMAKVAGLRYVSDQQPGYHRRRRGRGFSYVDWTGKTVQDAKVRERFEQLVIPPAWQEVWICRYENGHIQAVGRDDAGRKQYIYHPAWAAVRAQVKYSKLLAFGEALPDLRQRVAADLRQHKLTRTKVTALVITLMEQTLIRIGNDEYARNNDSYGLTTLQDDHVSFDHNTVTFEFRGKSGKEHEIALHDRRLAQLVKTCQELPGQRLFQYYDEDGELVALTSTDVNTYLREVTGFDFTAKDFRTWGGTLLTARLLHACGPARNKTEMKKQMVATVKQVAEALGNTPAICRQSYIHPAIFAAYEQNQLPDFYGHSEEECKELQRDFDELAVLGLLQNSSD
ncbi:MAG: DNA topoisomerase IB [Caldilineaceae bacterium]|nr:DNA topoisomerase IB [Caldilineaceae bacterium]